MSALAVETNKVTPHVGVWIETIILEAIDSLKGGHTSCRCVD